ncbi:MAG: lantibiotic dehydratase [Candidatus Eremiobacteraeota bacterium]|nr:lantibiotic dehydratase [Candidatus Eremiobacteraeota bacterium]
MAEESWELYPEFQLRTAGFPAEWLTEVESDEALDFESRFKGEAGALRRLFSKSMLSEALWWQSPQAARNLLPSLLKSDTTINSKFRRRLRKFQSYLQRYCAKNEAIGYFGPIGFGRWGESAGEDEGDWLSERTTYLEPWLVESLLESFFQNPAHRDERLCVFNPRLCLEERALYGDLRSRRAGGARVVPPEVSALLAATQRPRSLSKLVEEGHSRDTIEIAFRQNWLCDHFPLPSTAEPLVWAENYAARLEKRTQEALLSELAKLEQARSEIARQPDKEIPRFERLVSEFSRGETERHQGKAYGGRQGFYEDCRRRGFRIPESWLTAVWEPIALLLESARWVSFQSGSRLAEALEKAHQDLHRRYGDGYIATALWEASRPIFVQPESLDLDGIDRELARRWYEALGKPSVGEEAVRFEVSGLREAVEKKFSVPSYGFPSARFQSFDLFFSRDGQAVLGEIHPCLHTFNDPSTHFQHPHNPRLCEWYEERTPHPEIFPARQVPYTRLYQDGWSNRNAYHLLVDPAWGSWRDESKQLRLGDFRVFQEGSGVVVRHRSGLEFSLLSFFEADLRPYQAVSFSPFDFAAESPRIRIGDLVVARRTWTLRREEFADLESAKGSVMLLDLAARLRTRGLPSRVFVKYPHETKPVLLQFDSVVSLDLFWHLFRSGESCRCQEVLPGLEEAWIECSEGTGTGEFRFVVFDRRPYSEEAVWEEVSRFE